MKQELLTSCCLHGGSCLIYVICVCLHIMVFSTYCVVFFALFVFVLCVSVAGLSIFDCPFGILKRLFTLLSRIYVYEHVKNHCFSRAKNINNLLSFDV